MLRYVTLSFPLPNSLCIIDEKLNQILNTNDKYNIKFASMLVWAGNRPDEAEKCLSRCSLF
jgi:hypothetical protein